jgi:hypothetical protein
MEAAIAAMRDPARAHATEQDADLASKLEALLSPEQLKRSNFDVVQEIGQSCDYPNNLLTGAHLIAQGARRPPVRMLAGCSTSAIA